MDQRQADKALAQYMTPVRVIALGFSTTMIVYVGVAALLIEVFAFERILEVPFYIAASIAVLQLLVILAGYLVSLSMRKPSSAAAPTGMAPPGAGTDVDEAMQRYTKSLLVAAGTREFASVVGLVLTLLTGNLTWVLVLSGVALVSMLIHWPRRAAVEDFLQQQGIGH